MPRLAALIRYAAFAPLPLLVAGESMAWTVSKAVSCSNTSTYHYSRQVTIVTGSIATNAGMSIVAEWWPAPKATRVVINTWETGTVAKGSIIVERLCANDPWATGANCTGDKVIQQSNSKWAFPTS